MRNGEKAIVLFLDELLDGPDDDPKVSALRVLVLTLGVVE